jgi:hypothetical protein
MEDIGMTAPAARATRPGGLAGAVALCIALALCASAAPSPAAGLGPNGSAHFPLRVSPDGRYLVDSDGAPFRIQGEAMWDAPFSLTLAELRAYLDDRKARGFNTLLTDLTTANAYLAGSSAPWAKQLGGVGKPSALPFLKNLSGGAWDGDPTFTRHDADFSEPNDAFFAWMAQVADEAAARGMLLVVVPVYLGYNHGAEDGWSQTLLNQRAGGSGPAHNNVCYQLGQYLASGRGAFPGFRGKPNLLWAMGGDTTPAAGGEEALRSLDVLKGMQAAGDGHLVTSHWQHDVPGRSQVDFGPYLTLQGVYTHGPYPTLGPTHAGMRALYASNPALPSFLLETTYWGEHGATADQLRSFAWGAVLGGIGGYIEGFGPLWAFTISQDGASPPIPGADTTSWREGTPYLLNRYVSSNGAWWRLTAPARGGTSGPSRPAGTGPTFLDGTLTWTYVGPATLRALYAEGPILDVQRMGAFFDALAWYRLVPAGLGGTRDPVVDAGGAPAVWMAGTGTSGGFDNVAAAVDPDGTLLVAYVPGVRVTIDLSAMAGPARARWFDPTAARWVDITSGAFSLAATGHRAFVPPGPNGAAASDWVLVLDSKGGDGATERTTSPGCGTGCSVGPVLAPLVLLLWRRVRRAQADLRTP